MAKCASCNSRILVGGESYLKWRFCNPTCVANFKSRVVGQLLSDDVVEKEIQAAFEGPCPACGRNGRNDVWSATTVTGMLLMFSVNSQKKVCCASCARKHRLSAALHCLGLGWWSPRAAIINIFVLPTNLLALCLVRQPQQPSAPFRSLIKTILADRMSPQIEAAAIAASEASLDESDDASRN